MLLAVVVSLAGGLVVSAFVIRLIQKTCTRPRHTAMVARSPSMSAVTGTHGVYIW